MKTFALLFLGATVANAASWSKGEIPSGGIVSVSITAVKGVADTAILAGAPSSGGDGPHTYISSDYGQTFTPSAGKVGMDLMLLSVGASSGNANNVCVGGIVGVHHTQDGGPS